MTSSKKRASAKRVPARKTSSSRRVQRDSTGGRFVLFPTEQSTIGRKKIESAVEIVVGRRSS